MAVPTIYMQKINKKEMEALSSKQDYRPILSSGPKQLKHDSKVVQNKDYFNKPGSGEPTKDATNDQTIDVVSNRRLMNASPEDLR